MITTGTEVIESDLGQQITRWAEGRLPMNMVFISADWGFGKTHLRMLLTDMFLKKGIPFVHDQVDGKNGSLAHLHRAVPRWMESVQLGDCLGLRTVIETGLGDSARIERWCAGQGTEFSTHLMRGVEGHDWSWALAAGHQYQWPDYSYFHSRAFDLLRGAAVLLRDFGKTGICLLLDEAENISRQHDVRGRRKSYATLYRLAIQPEFFSVVFVTDRFFDQVAADLDRGRREGWYSWNEDAHAFLANLPNVPLSTPPKLDISLARQVVERIMAIYALAFGILGSSVAAESIVRTWERTATCSVRLLVRMTIEALDCMNH